MSEYKKMIQLRTVREFFTLASSKLFHQFNISTSISHHVSPQIKGSSDVRINGTISPRLGRIPVTTRVLAMTTGFERNPLYAAFHFTFVVPAYDNIRVAEFSFWFPAGAQVTIDTDGMFFNFSLAYINRSTKNILDIMYNIEDVSEHDKDAISTLFAIPFRVGERRWVSVYQLEL